MFWIGMIVGIVIVFALAGIIARVLGNMSWNEWCDCALLMCEAGQNRESTIMVCGDNGFVETYTLEEK